MVDCRGEKIVVVERNRTLCAARLKRKFYSHPFPPLITKNLIAKIILYKRFFNQIFPLVELRNCVKLTFLIKGSWCPYSVHERAKKG